MLKVTQRSAAGSERGRGKGQPEDHVSESASDPKAVRDSSEMATNEALGEKDQPILHMVYYTSLLQGVDAFDTLLQNNWPPPPEPLVLVHRKIKTNK